LREYITTIKQEEVLSQRFRFINERISIVDIPGIDDGIMGTEVKNYIEKNCERMIPVILIHLTGVGF
jgi:hypothetical protein